MMLHDLMKLLSLGHPQQTQVQPQHPAEDDALVNTPNGPSPLSSINQGQQWSQIPGRPQYPGVTNIGLYNQNGVHSIGGHLGPIGGSLGLDHGIPFGSWNTNGQIRGKFGPQG